MNENLIKESVATLLKNTPLLNYFKGVIVYHKDRPNDKDIIEDFKDGKFQLSGSTISILDLNDYKIFRGEQDLFLRDYVRTNDGSPSVYQIIKKNSPYVLLRSVHGDGEEKLIKIDMLLLPCGKPMFPKHYKK